MTMELKYVGGNIREIKEETRNGEPIGIVAGYIATWDIDRGSYGVRDQFVRGAFVDSLREHQVKRRQIRLKDQHGRTVGGFPIDSVHEDEVGLYAIGEVNLNVQLGREVMALARQGVLSDFSVGFSVVEFTEDQGLRKITKAILWEASVVDEPMNPKAVITEVKTVVAYQDLPIGPRDREWSKSEALARVKEFTDSDEGPSATYRNAFVWFDRENADEFGAYKLPIADVINGKLTAIPRAIFAAAAALSGARGGVDLPENDKATAIQHIERYYAKMDMPSPFEDDEKQYFVADDVKEWTQRDVERALRNSGMFSKSAAVIIAGKMKGVDKPAPVDDNNAKILDELKSMKKLLE